LDLRRQLRRHRKDNRLIVGVLAVLLVVFTAAYYLLQRSRELDPLLVTNRVLLFVLMYINVVLILTILFVLLRNVFKLLVERHHRILGSKFKTKLVLTYIGLSLIPVLLLFALSTQLLRGSIERWFNTPVEEILPLASSVAQGLQLTIEGQNLHDAQRVVDELGGLDLDDPAVRPRLVRRLPLLQAELGVDYLAVYRGTEFIHAVVASQAGIADLPEPGRGLLMEAVLHGTSRGQPPALVEGALLLGAASPGPEAGDPPLVVVIGRVLPPELATPVREVIEANQGHRQLVIQRDEITTSYLLIFLMVTLLILLASSWVGLYLARRVTVPIQALADGTLRISGGDLDHRVEVEADDELGVLVDSFNRMTAELGASRGALERSNRELSTTNERLAEERALIATLLDNVAAGVISVDAEGSILTANGAALAMLRQREAELVGRSVGEAWADGERRKLAQLLEGAAPGGRLTKEVHLILGGEWKTFEVKVTSIHGTTLRQAARTAATRPAVRFDDTAEIVLQGLDGGSAPTGGDGDATGSGETPGASRVRVMVLEDLTELIKAQQLAAWREAARRIAHEIKNPLTPIKLAAERLLAKHHRGDGELGQALEEGVEIIVREVTTLQGMVDEFSRYARMPRPQPVHTDLAALVDETLNLYRNLKSGVEVVSAVDAEARQAWLDPEQVRRVLINLLDNALEATTAPGQVTVAARRDDGHLRIDVADTGRGIPPEAKEKLFLPYFSTKGRGTGLGLAIVHRIVTDHHGSIRVEDNAPRGTVFVIELPLQ
jgi:two-component system nitrogen regulation sensor histidine kinase NtrY